MSLFTATSATPERVWALARLLLALEGRADRTLVAGLLDPRFSQGRTTGAESAAFQQTVQAAAGLGLVLREGDSLMLLVPDVAPDLDGFADQVHATLCVGGGPDGGDALLLDGFAVLAAECDLEGGTDWLLGSPRDALVDRLNARLAEGKRAGTSGMLNTSRLPQWFRWMAFLGLATFLSAGGRDRPYPYVLPRIARELAGREGLPRGAEVPARDVVTWIARRMPYLEGGSLQREVVAGIAAGVGTRVSMLVSVALRDLHDDGVLRLVASGDAGDNLPLAEDKYHSVAAFRAAVVADRSDSEGTLGRESNRNA